MQIDNERQKLGYRSGSFRWRVQGLVVRVLAVAAGAVLLLGAIAVSIVLFAVALTGVLAFGGYFWWKTRDLRKQMRARMADGDVIEGEVVRDVQSEDPKRPRLP
ncbi:MAG: hypothetical protein ACREV5_18905 [Steroidobacter sp.]